FTGPVCHNHASQERARQGKPRAYHYEKVFACYISRHETIGGGAMRVAQISEFGGIAALRLEEAAEPAPGPGEILVRVTAVGLNFSDTLILRNKYQVTPPLPFSPGAEIAGSVEGLGGGVTDLKLGQRIVACTGGRGRGGGVVIR